MIKLLSREEKTSQILEAVEKLKAGEVIDVLDASYSAHSLAIGDFRTVCMAEKNVWRTGMNWTWKGPGTIRVNGKVYEPGEQTEEIDMDWT
jgi:predicted transcriptional regulator